MPKTTIIPAIIPQSLGHLREAIAKLGGFAGEIQIDIVDGKFVPYRSWPYNDPFGLGEGIASRLVSLAETVPHTIPFELDLMIEHPLETLPLWLVQRPKSVVIHIEGFASDPDVMRAIEMIRAAGASAIVTALNDTPLDRLCAFAAHCDGIQCTGIREIGKQGSLFDIRVLARLREIREAYPALPLAVDGSVNRDTIALLLAVGASRFVVGSGIFSSDDPVRAYAELRYLVKRNMQ